MSDSGSSTPPGWYPDGQGGQRWWDGTAWGPEGQPPAMTPRPETSYEAPTPTAPMPTSPPPQYAPPGFPPPGQDPSQAGAAGRNPKVLFGIVGGLVGVLVLVIVLVLVLSGGNGPSSDDPAETVASFFDAAEDGDCDAAFDLLTDNARNTFGAGVDECESADPSDAFGQGASIDIGDAEVDGDSATVPVSVEDESGDLGGLGGLGEVTLDFELEKQDGVWLIDGFGFGSLLDNLPDFSDLPDDPFSDLPDDLFTDFPTDLPTDLFSDFPTDLFSDFPTDFPTDFNPEDFMSDFPTDLFSDFPTE